MGIGNGRALRGYTKWLQGSLPLMGIGNPVSDCRPGRCSARSLPLMGIGNPRWPGRPCQQRSKLITPHGDRKPGALVGDRRGALTLITLMGIGNALPAWSIASADSISLPLMGIGNGRLRGCRWWAGPVLITPHGDRKPPVYLPIDRRTNPAHYPSWGSETGIRCAYGRGENRLITPHGDRKRTPALRPVYHTRGLITPHGDRKQHGLHVGAGEYPVSLPLMGIGNGRKCLVCRGTGQLITPHGDRKRACLTARVLRRQPHYPSWGSET